jgi:hypothetical protein
VFAAGIIKVLMPLFYVFCAAPFAKAIFLWVPFAEDLVSSLLKQGFKHSPVLQI